ncbi:hypothetical protein HQ590_15640, partial [bacterium]|nr:hypothetical protein [bacterium]
TTARAHRVARGSGGWVACTGVTNDDGAANLSTLSPWPGSSVQTARLGRLQELRAGKPDRIGLADLQQWQRDHNQGGLCAHAGTGFGLPCLCAFICDVPAGRMWLTHGSPCRAEYVPMDLQPATVPGRAKGRR